MNYIDEDVFNFNVEEIKEENIITCIEETNKFDELCESL